MIRRRLLLIGAGHAHAQVVLAWASSPLPGVELCVVSPVARAPYSGMVPGWLAGLYRTDDVVVDFERLCARAGARWVPAELQRLDAARRVAHLASGEALPYDVLSFNIGSTLRPPVIESAAVLALRPLSRLFPAWEALQQRWHDDPARTPLRLMAVGGGAASFESLLAAVARLRSLRPDREVSGTLVTRADRLLPGFAPGAVRAAERALKVAGLQLRLRTDWQPDMGHECDLVLWATGAQPHEWQTDPARRGGLAVTDDGFIRVDKHLRSVSHPQVLATGDCAGWTPPLPKAGVYAVRQGPVLVHNLRAALGEGDALTYEPQQRFLALLATGDGRAIASRGIFSAEGRWVWRWKDRIDRRFIARFS